MLFESRKKHTRYDEAMAEEPKSFISVKREKRVLGLNILYITSYNIDENHDE